MASATPEHVLVEYEAGLNQLRGLLAIVPPDQWDTSTAPGEWSARQIIAHLSDSEVVYASRLRYALAEDTPHVVGYNEQHWVDRLQYAEAAIEETTALAIVLRRSTLTLLKRASQDQWQRPLIDDRKGGVTITLVDVVQGAINHLNTHVAQLEGIAAHLAAV